MRDYREANPQSHAGPGSGQEEANDFVTLGNEIGQSDSPESALQLKALKDDMQNVQNLITEDVFQMIDNLSQALTEKDGEVNELKEKLATQDGQLQKCLETVTGV